MNISQNEGFTLLKYKLRHVRDFKSLFEQTPFKVGSSIWEVFGDTPQTGACITGHCG